MEICEKSMMGYIAISREPFMFLARRALVRGMPSVLHLSGTAMQGPAPRRTAYERAVSVAEPKQVILLSGTGRAA